MTMTVFGMKLLLALAMAVSTEAVRNEALDVEPAKTVVNDVKDGSRCHPGEYDMAKKTCTLDGHYTRFEIDYQGFCIGGVFFASQGLCYLPGVVMRVYSKPKDCIDQRGVYVTQKGWCFLKGLYTRIEGKHEGCDKYFAPNGCYMSGIYTRVDGVRSSSDCVDEDGPGIYIGQPQWWCYLKGRYTLFEGSCDPYSASNLECCDKFFVSNQQCYMRGIYTRVDSVSSYSDCDDGKGHVYSQSWKRCYLKGRYTLVQGGCDKHSPSNHECCDEYFGSNQQCYIAA